MHIHKLFRHTLNEHIMKIICHVKISKCNTPRLEGKAATLVLYSVTLKMLIKVFQHFTVKYKEWNFIFLPITLSKFQQDDKTSYDMI